MPRAEVEFTGQRAETAPFTWGQRTMWNAIAGTVPDDAYFNIGRVLAVPSRAERPTVARVTEALGWLLTRHESLRTRVRLDDEPCQVVERAGRLPLAMIESSPERAAQAAQHMCDRLAAPAFDYAAELPIRVGVVTYGSVVRYVVIVFCHLAADGHGAEAALRDLRLLLLRGSVIGAPPQQPLDLANYQRSPAGQRIGRTALAYRENAYRRVSPAMFPTFPMAGPPEQSRFRSARLSSSAMDAAMRLVASRTRVSTSTVLLTAASMVTGALSGQGTCALVPVVHNRFRPGSRDMVTTLWQDGLFVLDLGDSTFGKLLPQAWRASLRAYRHAQYDPVEGERVSARVDHERGASIDPYLFNDQRLVHSILVNGHVPDGAAVRAALAETTFDWWQNLDRLACRFCLYVMPEPEPGTLMLALAADTHHMPSGEMERYLRGLEALLVEAALREVRLSEVPRLLERAVM